MSASAAALDLTRNVTDSLTAANEELQNVARKVLRHCDFENRILKD